MTGISWACDPLEAGALVKDLLIHVTAFFRDPEAWDALDREVITPIVEAARRGQAIRVWVPACSTGEEAYTIAIVLDDMIRTGSRFQFRILGTDISTSVLQLAKAAVYTRDVTAPFLGAPYC